MDIRPNVVPFVTPSNNTKSQNLKPRQLKTGQWAVTRWVQAIKKSDLGVQARTTAIWLSTFMDNDSLHTHVSAETLAEASGQGLSTVKKALKILVGKGFLETLKRRYNQSSIRRGVIPGHIHIVVNDTPTKLRIAATPDEITAVMNNFFKIPDEPERERKLCGSLQWCPTETLTTHLTTQKIKPLSTAAPPPIKFSLADIMQRVIKNGADIDPVRFYEHFQAIGWKKSGQPITDPDPLIRQWAQSENPKKRQKRVNRMNAAQYAKAEQHQAANQSRAKARKTKSTREMSLHDHLCDTSWADANWVDDNEALPHPSQDEIKNGTAARFPGEDTDTSWAD